MSPRLCDNNATQLLKKRKNSKFISYQSRIIWELGSYFKIGFELEGTSICGSNKWTSQNISASRLRRSEGVGAFSSEVDEYQEKTTKQDAQGAREKAESKLAAAGEAHGCQAMVVRNYWTS